MKKRIVSAILIITMVMALTACGSTTADPVADATVEESASEATQEAASEASEEAVAEASTEEATEDVEFTVGTVTDNAYENEYFGIKVNLLDDFSFVDDETLARITGMTTDILSDNKLAAKAIEDGTATIIAYATNSTGLSNINVTAQTNAGFANAIFDEEAVLIASIDQAKSALEPQGINNITYEIVDKVVAGENHKVLMLNGDYSGVEFHNEMVNLQKDSYMLAVAATSFSENMCDEMIDAIEVLN